MTSLEAKLLEQGQGQLSWLESKLMSDIERQEAELRQLEQQLGDSLHAVSSKMRRLQMRKRQPVQCLVNVVACW